jgi:antitoxin HicB
MSELSDYPFEIRPLTVAEGGGFLIAYPDFSECIADGETVEEAIANGREALAATVAALIATGFPVPKPNSGGVASGKFVARVPKSIHAQLAARAKAEGVSLNTLVVAFIAEGLGRREAGAADRQAGRGVAGVA